MLARKNKVSEAPWTLEIALPLIQQLEPMVRDLNYHTLLGGGVLHRPGEHKDLDLWFMPLNGFESDSKPVLELLMSVFGRPNAIRDSPDYAAGDPWHLKDALWFEYEGHRIDCFIQ